jgi:signal transduction histidine kinase
LERLPTGGTGAHGMSEDQRISIDALRERRLAWLLLTKREVLLERWARRVVADPIVPTANTLSWPALDNSMPELIARLLGRLTRHPPAGWGERVGREVGASEDVGVAHAKHRFAVHYTVAEALRELSHFRAALLELCHEYAIEITVEEAKLMHATIDEMMATSATQLESSSSRAHEAVMAVVAHDLRNPLNVIALQAARMAAGNAVDAVSVGGALGRAVQRMLRLVDDLLVFTGLEAGHLRVRSAPVDVRSTAQYVVEQLAPAALRQKVTLTFLPPTEEVEVVCDSDRIEQALGNLVANAIKFTPAGGSVRVTLEAKSEHVVFRVTDTGPGVHSDHAEGIFRPFWQAPGATKQGVGLGLAITRGIVEAHGGTLILEHTPGPGAAFSFTLPLEGAARGSSSFKVASPDT